MHAGRNDSVRSTSCSPALGLPSVTRIMSGTAEAGTGDERLDMVSHVI